MILTDLLTAPEAQRGFYPTPPALAEKLVAGLDWGVIKSILEPSAGKGDLVWRAAQSYRAHFARPRDCSLSVDCVEIDPALRGVLHYEFGGRREKELAPRLSVLRQKQDDRSDLGRRGELPPEEKWEFRRLEAKVTELRCLDARVIHDDFLTLDTRKRYDLILMNPPFTDGDRHLLKAIEMQSRFGGAVRCLLNCETLLNPYSNLRGLLKQKLDELGASIEFVDGAFSEAERRSSVRVAVIKIEIPRPRFESSIFERLNKAASAQLPPIEEITDLAVTDFIQHIVSRFNVEIDAGLELMREYEAMRPHILDSLKESDSLSYPTMTLIVGDTHRALRGDAPDVDQYVRLVRLKYWKALFSNDDFTGKLTSNLREKYSGMVGEMANYDFTVFNIKTIKAQMNSEISTGIKETIVAMFDRLTADHAWYPETQKNVHYYNGWKTNKVHKVNGKVILPTSGMFSDYSWSKTFEVRHAYDVISDIEKVFNFLDGRMTEEVSLQGVLERACEAGQTKNIPCKFFDVTLYKKGTMHIRFHNQELVDRFNIYVAKNKNWLPPCYGRKEYADMAREEQAVVDGFHGDGAPGAGEADYRKMMERRSYYLADPAGELPALAAPISDGE